VLFFFSFFFLFLLRTCAVFCAVGGFIYKMWSAWTDSMSMLSKFIIRIVYVCAKL
jgi:hypothetical protein